MMNRRLHLESLENRQMLTGAMQVSGIADAGGVIAPEEVTVCTAEDAPKAPQGTTLTYSMKMNGDVLNGCFYSYAFVDENGDYGQFSPSGTYRERGIDIYVGSSAEGDDGGFETTYLFTGKFGEEAENEIGEFWGRCQHPITPDTGWGSYEGVIGRLDFKDIVAEKLADFKFHYKGHLRFANDIPNHKAVDAALAASLAADDDSQDALFDDTEL